MQINSITKMRIKRRRFAKKLKQNNVNLTNFAWGLVVLGGIVECFWVSGLKHADSPLLYALTALGIAFSFSAMIVACKVLEVSIAYSVFVGIGTAGVVASEILIFGGIFRAESRANCGAFVRCHRAKIYLAKGRRSVAR